MKIRTGFVSNSSSCSFTIPLKDLTAEQIENIKNPEKKAIEIGYLSKENFDLYWGGWTIRVNSEDNTLNGFTCMDNFGMYEYLEKLGFDMDKMDIDDDNNGWSR